MSRNQIIIKNVAKTFIFIQEFQNAYSPNDSFHVGYVYLIFRALINDLEELGGRINVNGDIRKGILELSLMSWNVFLFVKSYKIRNILEFSQETAC